MKTLIISVLSSLFYLNTMCQVVSVKADEVIRFTCTDVEEITNGFGYLIHYSVDYGDQERYTLDFRIDLNNKKIERSVEEHQYYTFSDCYYIDSLSEENEQITLSFQEYVRFNKEYFTAYISYTTINDGEYPVFIYYRLIGDDVTGYFLQPSFCEIAVHQE